MKDKKKNNIFILIKVMAFDTSDIFKKTEDEYKRVSTMDKGRIQGEMTWKG